MNITRALGLPTPKTKLVRVSPNGQSLQSPSTARTSSSVTSRGFWFT